MLRGIALQASSEMGHNHLFLNSGPWPQTGGSSGDSLWGGIGMLVGPASSFARVTFSGRVDGSLAGDSSLTYGLAIATSASSYSLIVDQTDTSTERWSAFGNGIVDVPLGTTRHSSALYDTFRIALTLPTNTPIGIQSFLSATSQEGAVANLFHTAGIDEIVVPVGFTFSSNGSPLAFDGTGYSYPLAAVPEPSTMLMLATGLAMIGVAAGRKLRTHSKLAQPSIEPEGLSCF